MTNEKITIVTWLWREGFRPGAYDHRHVNRLHEQLKKHMTGEWRLVCVTDDPAGIECETYPLWAFPEPDPAEWGADMPNCFRRIELFNPDTWSLVAGGSTVILSLDLDVTVYADLRPLITKSGFKVALNKRPKNGLKFCGTVWQLRRGHRPDVRAEYHPTYTPRTIRLCGLKGSDQSWFMLKLFHEPTWDERNGVYWVKRLPRTNAVPTNARLIYFAGGMKPWDRDCQLIAPKLYTPLQPLDPTLSSTSAASTAP